MARMARPQVSRLLGKSSGRFFRAGRRLRGLRRRSGAAGLLFAIALWAAQGPVKTALPGPLFEGRATRIVDGDTLRVSGVGAPVRLWGVDAPERGQHGGGAASEHLRMIAQGRRLECKRMDVDRYRRIVARCFIVETGEDIGERMIRSGRVDEYLHYTGGFYMWRGLAKAAAA